MCGIAGIIDFTKDISEQRLINKMTETLAHRGPDREGYFASKHALLGHKRLAIIDLVAGSQPMTKAAYTIVYNGELYNTEEIRSELEKLLADPDRERFPLD